MYFQGCFTAFASILCSFTVQHCTQIKQCWPHHILHNSIWSTSWGQGCYACIIHV